MTTTKHTPGPWRLCPDACKVDAILDLEGFEGYAGIIADANISYAIPLEQMKANARLIAAAPELLEACEYVLRTLRAPDCPSIPDGAYTRGKIVAAIKKAKGE